MKFPVVEIVDRYAIAVVKFEMTVGENKRELDFYTEQMNQSGLSLDHPLILELIEHHKYVWSLEDDIKKGKADSLPLEEIGRRALHVRDVMRKRTELKNALAEVYNDPIREIKHYSV
jgi:hypothetical protein